MEGKLLLVLRALELRWIVLRRCAFQKQFPMLPVFNRDSPHETPELLGGRFASFGAMAT